MEKSKKGSISDYQNALSEYNRDLKTLMCIDGRDETNRLGHGECVWSKIEKPDGNAYGKESSGQEVNSCTDPSDGRGNCGIKDFGSNEGKIVYDSTDTEPETKFYYVNRFGYKKLLGKFSSEKDPSTGKLITTAPADVNPSCNGKEIVGLTSNELSKLLDYTTNANANTIGDKHELLKRCDDGDYNIYLTDGSQNVNPDENVAYLSPGGDIYPYNNDIWNKLKTDNSLCASKTLKAVNVTSLANDEYSTNTNLWGGTNVVDINKFKAGTLAPGQESTTMANCFPYASSNEMTYYTTNVKQFIDSTINLNRKQQIYVDEINKLDNKILSSTNEGSIKKLLNNEIQNTDNGVDTKLVEFEKQRKELDLEKNKLIAKKSAIDELEREKNSVQMQKYLWLGSAVVLGAIIVKGVNNF